ncbi:MAG: CTP synthase [Paludibacteraceae bacterium]|nr:CTP synthase [Paludibacteraceae bacterium]
MTRYIFVTGGVVSSLGKGIISSSIGKLLQDRGYSITIQKFDPYINIDPGTLNPYEHGECYVTVDGMETDLDLGHYERFTGIHTTRNNSITTGRIYKTVIDRERRGDYLGKTIQVVPHITDEIKRRMLRKDEEETGTLPDFVITEVGGTIGDIESAPFMEAIRQLRWELGKRAACVHLTYVPYLKAADELKTKPTQHSVKEMQGMGIQPDVLILRTEKHLSDSVRQKVASFCNVDLECVVQSEDMPSIYEVPVSMQQQGLDAALLRKFGIPVGETPKMERWHKFLEMRRNATRIVKIGLVGKYDLQDAYKSIRESIILAGIYNGVKIELKFINSEHTFSAETWKDIDGVVICPGFGKRGIEGKIEAVKYCRENNIPTFGICLGMQMMVIEFARDVLGYTDANSSEMDSETPHNVIDIMEEQKTITEMGGTMRLGAYDCDLLPGSRVRQIYNEATIQERHRHRYEFNNKYLDEFEKNGMMCVGRNPKSNLVEIVEIPGLKWFIGTQFHPEYSSSVLNPHPLFMNFVKTIIDE